MAAEDWKAFFFHHPFESRPLGLQAVDFITALAISSGLAALLLLKNYVLDSTHGKSANATEDLPSRAHDRGNGATDESSLLCRFRSLFRSVSSENRNVLEAPATSCVDSQDSIRKERQYSPGGEGNELTIAIDCNWSSVTCVCSTRLPNLISKAATAPPSEPAAKNFDARNEKFRQFVSKKESTENLADKLPHPILKKVRFAADVVEPSGNNREYRRRVKSALIIKGASACNERPPSIKRHPGNPQISTPSAQVNGPAFELKPASDIPFPGIAQSLSDVVKTHRSHAHQRRRVHIMACDGNFFSDPKPTSEENRGPSFGASCRQIGTSQSGQPWKLQRRELAARNDPKLSFDPDGETTRDPFSADHHKNINISPPHQRRAQTLAASSLPANRMALYNGIQQYRLQRAQYC